MSVVVKVKSQDINGFAAPGFEAVKAAFAEHFLNAGEVGAALCIERNGERLVDLWGGHTDGAHQRPWTADTLANVWSTTKGAMAATIAHLVSEGVLDYGAPVARYWPAFGAAGKEHITVAELFSHQAGLVGPEIQLTVDALYDVDAVADLLATQAPQWPLGSRSGYHAISIGYLAEGLVRRVAGCGLGELFRRAIAAPLGLDFHLGLPEALEPRASEMLDDGLLLTDRPGFDRLQTLSQVHMPIAPGMPNERRWRAMGIASAGGMASARGVAGLYRHLLSDLGGRTRHIATAATLEAALRLQISNEDLVLHIPVNWGIGFALNGDLGFYGPNAAAFGHHGWGGSTGFADPATGISFGYVMNYMRDVNHGDPRAQNLIRATYAALGEARA